MNKFLGLLLLTSITLSATEETKDNQDPVGFVRLRSNSQEIRARKKKAEEETTKNLAILYLQQKDSEQDEKSYNPTVKSPAERFPEKYGTHHNKNEISTEKMKNCCDIL